MEGFVHALIDGINGILWNYVLIALLLGAGAWFTLRFRMIQLRALFLSMRLVGSKGEPGSISSFQAFATGLASRVGTGNIAGVAVAMTVGGPGAIFWMWMTALVGMSSAFVEATLAQIFKVSHHDGTYRGGPAYYIQIGLRSRGFGVLFSLSLILAFGFVFNAVQANAIAEAFNTSFGVSRAAVGLALVALTAPIIFGGIRRIAHVAQVIVPVMAIGYLALAVYAVATHVALVPDMIVLIVKSAFGLEQAAGGLSGYAVSQAVSIGVKRGLFSNEAGMGSAPNAAATASTRHPVTQGLIQMLGVFVDTIVICSATAFVILLSGQYEPGTSMAGAALTQRAISSHVGDWGGLHGGGDLLPRVFFGDRQLRVCGRQRRLRHEPARRVAGVPARGARHGDVRQRRATAARVGDGRYQHGADGAHQSGRDPAAWQVRARRMARLSAPARGGRGRPGVYPPDDSRAREGAPGRRVGRARAVVARRQARGGARLGCRRGTGGGAGRLRAMTMAGDRLRCFVALTLDRASRDALAALPVAAGARRTPRDQLHVTIAFLGAIERAKSELLGARIPALAAAGAVPPVDVERVVCWPSTAHARLVVAELAPQPSLLALGERVGGALRALGLPPDSRAFKPHVTIARFPRDAHRVTIDGACGAERRTPLALRFETLTLYESVLTRMGAEHRVLAAAALPA